MNATTPPEPTLAWALLARGFTYRAPASGVRAEMGAKDIVRISDGVVVTTLKAGPAWEWLHAFDRQVAKAKTHRHDFRDGDVCSTCDAVRGSR